jgi:hypothetical protein
VQANIEIGVGVDGGVWLSNSSSHCFWCREIKVLFTTIEKRMKYYAET